MNTPANTPKILLFELAADPLGTVRQMLQICGCAVVTARNLDTAFRLLEQQKDFRLIVANGETIDAQELHNLQIIRDIRPAGLPMLLLGTTSQPERVTAAISSGATDYLSKPLDKTLFAAKIHEIIHGKSDAKRGREFCRRRISTNAFTNIKLRGYNSKQLIFDCDFPVPPGARFPFTCQELSKQAGLPFTQRYVGKVNTCTPCGRNYRLLVDLLGQPLNLPSKR